MRVKSATRRLLQPKNELLLEKVLESLAAAGMTQLAQRLGFDLTNAFARHAKLLPDFLQRAGPAVLQAEAQAQDALLAVG